MHAFGFFSPINQLKISLRNALGLFLGSVVYNLEQNLLLLPQQSSNIHQTVLELTDLLLKVSSYAIFNYKEFSMDQFLLT